MISLIDVVVVTVVLAIINPSELLYVSVDVTVAVALEHSNEKGETEVISIAINKAAGGELFYCEKGTVSMKH